MIVNNHIFDKHTIWEGRISPNKWVSALYIASCKKMETAAMGKRSRDSISSSLIGSKKKELPLL
jgi:hypothetical protein